MTAIIINAVGAFATALSAICWIRSATMAAPVLESYWDHAPKEVTDKLEAQSKWNARAAGFAAIAAAAQAFSAWLT